MSRKVGHRLNCHQDLCVAPLLFGCQGSEMAGNLDAGFMLNL